MVIISIQLVYSYMKVLSFIDVKFVMQITFLCRGNQSDYRAIGGGWRIFQQGRAKKLGCKGSPICYSRNYSTRNTRLVLVVPTVLITSP